MLCIAVRSRNEHIQCHYQITVSLYKSLLVAQPTYIRLLLEQCQPTRSLRSVRQNLLALPTCRPSFADMLSAIAHHLFGTSYMLWDVLCMCVCGLRRQSAEWQRRRCNQSHRQAAVSYEAGGSAQEWSRYSAGFCCTMLSLWLQPSVLWCLWTLSHAQGCVM